MAKKRSTKQAAKRSAAKKSKRSTKKKSKAKKTRSRKKSTKKRTRKTSTKRATSKRTSKRRSTKKKRASRRADEGPRAVPKEDPVEPLRPEDGEMIVRMYRQGLGDCFLLAFSTFDPDRPSYLLIDCGVHMRQTKGTDRLQQVMQHLAKTTQNHINIVVATHEHADHLSGFVQKNSPFFKKSLTIGQLWVGWTEKFGIKNADPDAERLRKQKAAARDVIEKAVDEAIKKNNPGFAKRLGGLMDFEIPQVPLSDSDRKDIMDSIRELVGDDAELVARMEGFGEEEQEPALGVADKKKKRKKKPLSSNELALGLLSAKAETVKYFLPGKTAAISGVENVRAYVLGPPKWANRQDREDWERYLKKDLPSKVRGGHDHEYKETYLSGNVELQSMALAPALGVSGDSHEFAQYQQYPFAWDYRRSVEGRSKRSDGDWGDDMKREEATSAFFKEHYFGKESSWRRIDSEWLGPAEQLALHLDSDTNNTSLCLAIELGDPGSGAVLLFPGDAQVGNWLSWRFHTYKAGGVSMGADDLLKRTLIYKCGHHGSHNATLKNFVRIGSRDDGEPYGLELMNDIIAMIPVDREAAQKKMPNSWKMPHEPLYKRLRTKADRRVLRADRSKEPLPSNAASDVVPTSEDWTTVPGLPNLQWRRSEEQFEYGTEGPLYYDIKIPLGPKD